MDNKILLYSPDYDKRFKPIPNIALMKIANYHITRGDKILPFNDFRLSDKADKIYVSCMFSWNRDKIPELPRNKTSYGGCGYDFIIQDNKWKRVFVSALPEHILHEMPYYDLYNLDYSMGFTSRGCIRSCPFCIVPLLEGKIRPSNDIYEFYDRRFNSIRILDNNLLALRKHFNVIAKQIIKEKIYAQFDGLDARILTEEQAGLFKQMKLESAKLKFALDLYDNIESVERGLKLIKKYGLYAKAMFYCLLDAGETIEQELERMKVLSSYKVSIYPMFYNNNFNKVVRILKKHPIRKDFSEYINRTPGFQIERLNYYIGYKSGLYNDLLDEIVRVNPSSVRRIKEADAPNCLWWIPNDIEFKANPVTDMNVNPLVTRLPMLIEKYEVSEKEVKELNALDPTGEKATYTEFLVRIFKNKREEWYQRGKENWDTFHKEIRDVLTKYDRIKRIKNAKEFINTDILLYESIEELERDIRLFPLKSKRGGKREVFATLEKFGEIVFNEDEYIVLLVKEPQKIVDLLNLYEEKIWCVYEIKHATDYAPVWFIFKNRSIVALYSEDDKELSDRQDRRAKDLKLYEILFKAGIRQVTIPNLKEGKFGIELIRKYKDEINEDTWKKISSERLSEDFIREFKDKVNWKEINYPYLSEDFIREFKDRVDWHAVSCCKTFSEDFFREFKDRVDWKEVVHMQKFSEDFIREFKDRVDWGWISKYQKLSENFIREFKDKVNWEWISAYQELSEGFKKEFKDYL